MDRPDLSQPRQRFPQDKQAHLEKFLQQTRRTSSTQIVRQPLQSEAPLSPSQERLWFLDQLMPQSTAYHLPLLLRLSGKLDEQALEEALKTVGTRHEAFRTSFHLHQGHPVQRITPGLTLSLVKHDLSSYSPAQARSQAQDYINSELDRPFDLKQPPLIRALLFTIDSQEQYLFFVLHHIIGDAWSLRVLIQEMSTLYQAYSMEQTSPLTTLPLQMRDYVAWLQSAASDQEKHLTYWQKQLHNIPTLLQLPTDHARPPVQGQHGAWIECRLSPSLLDALQTLTQQERVTPYMLFLAAYAVLLSRYSNETDILMGSPIAQRTRSGLEQIIGFVANTLVLRADLSGNPPFLEFLKRIRSIALEAFTHADVAFEKVVERIQPVRDTSYSPIFQVMFLYQNIVQAPIQAGELCIEVEAVEEKGAQFDLTLVVTHERCRFQYNTDLFDASTIERMAAHFTVLLHGIAQHPEQRIADLPLLTEDERHKMLVAWNTDQQFSYASRHQSNPPQSKDAQAYVGIHTLFEQQAGQTPTAVAATFEDQSITYHELNEKANQMAHLLIARGVGPEVLVGLAMERSIEFLVALFGILKAGGAYLPLDPQYPRERILFLLKEGRVSLLLTQPHIAPHLPEHSAQVICLDTQWECIAAEPTHNPPGRSTTDNMVYVIFTSGSTGQPKGVVVRHGALINHARAMVEAIELTPQDCFLQFASISFDASAVQIFPTLISGATLALHRAPTELSNYDLWRFCKDKHVTILDVPTAFWHQWIEDMAASNLPLQPPLRVFMTGGEMPAIDKVRLWGSITKQPATFISSYGPTETTITATIFSTTHDGAALEHRQVVPIGRPIANVHIYLLNQSMNPVPLGVVGEVYIGGIGLARGYLNHPELTAERFVPHPFSTEPDARLYKTGDLARYLSDGTIEFQGRSDNQVKIRGFRIELGEIEALLRTHWAVQGAVVRVHEKSGLVAYIVPNKDDEHWLKQLQEEAGEQFETTDTLADTHKHALISLFRRFLKEKLPNYMIPSTFVLIDKFPLTPHSKVDYQALPPPTAGIVLKETYTKPRTDIEELLQKVWADILGGVQVGIHDSFFELGGHSLLATQLISQIRHVFKIEVPLATLFEAPTIAEFAQALLPFEKQPGQLLAIAKRRKQIERMSPEEIRSLLQKTKQAKG